MTRVLVCAGGTGGHIFPAIATIKALQKNNHESLLLTDHRFDTYKSTRTDVALSYLPLRNFNKRNILSKTYAIFKAMIYALRVILKYRPNVVIGFGGYVTFAALTVAWLLGIKIVLHEQNAVLGRVNRCFFLFAHRVAICFDKVKYINNYTKCIKTGNPVTEEIVATPYTTFNDKINVLVLGGSQGAKIFGEIVPQAINNLPDNIKKKLFVIQQCRKEQIQEVSSAYAQEIDCDLRTFFPDVAEKIKAAHLIICRAGASTIAEITTIGRPAIYVPYPHAKNDHQTYNVLPLVKANAGILIKQEVLTAQHLSRILNDLLANATRLQEMSIQARKQAIDNGAEKLVSLLSTY